MPDLRPFRGLRYDSATVGDLSALICPPYDVISVAERAQLAWRHPANAVHVELPASYEDAAARFARWQADGTLRRDAQPLIYVYEQRYELADAQPRRARGFLCRLRLEPTSGAGGVRAHEHTMAGPKQDRFQLLRAVRANLSPVVLLFEAPGAPSVDSLLDELTAGAPAVDASDDAGTSHRLWLADPASTPAAELLISVAAAGPLTIADGHHRYQTALRYCAEVGGDGSDKVLALLFEATTGGLSVLATHRLIKAPGVDIAARAASAFDAERVQRDRVVPAASGEIGVLAAGISARLRSPRALPDALDVSVLDGAYPALLGATEPELTAQGRISYTQDASAALAAVDSGQADAAFLLAPTPVAAVLAAAAAGEVMPPKSTFFYPKAATGLVFSSLAP